MQLPEVLGAARGGGVVAAVLLIAAARDGDGEAVAARFVSTWPPLRIAACGQGKKGGRAPLTRRCPGPEAELALEAKLDEALVASVGVARKQKSRW